ncbi:MAG: hypothetical protein PVF50_04980 [Gammaproteobacteria bacterium]|jgi:hypothetical protein
MTGGLWAASASAEALIVVASSLRFEHATNNVAESKTSNAEYGCMEFSPKTRRRAV